MYTKELKIKVNYLVKNIAQKDESALTELYNLTYKVIFKFLRRYSNDSEIIKDCISMTFITIIEKSNDKLFFTNCLSWILTISKFHIFNSLKKYSKYDNLPDNFEIEDNSELENSIFIKTLLNQLDENNKKLFYLRFYLRLKINEISKIMKVSTSTIKRQLKALQNIIKDYLNNE